MGISVQQWCTTHFGRIWWPWKRPSFCVEKRNFLSPLATDTTGKLDVLGHDGHTLGVDGTQVGVLKETNQVSLRSLLQGHDGGALESQISLEVLGNLTDQTLEWQLADEELCALLVSTDFTQSYSSRPVTMGLLHSSGSWGTLTSCLGGQLFPWSLASSGFTGSLLSTSHLKFTLIMTARFRCCFYTGMRAYIRQPTLHHGGRHLENLQSFTYLDFPLHPNIVP